MTFAERDYAAPKARPVAAPDALAEARRWRLAYAACVVLVLAFHFRLALPDRALVANDIRALFIALRAGVVATVRGGEWPFWQRGMFLGYPILGDPQPALFDPLTWLTAPLSPARGVTVQSLAHLCLAATGMAYWMRRRGLGCVEGVFAGAAFALCLKETVHLHHWTFAGSTCAWPWMLGALEGYALTGRAREAVLGAAATAGTWFGASPQLACFGTALALAYALLLASRALRSDRTTAAAREAAARALQGVRAPAPAGDAAAGEKQSTRATGAAGDAARVELQSARATGGAGEGTPPAPRSWRSGEGRARAIVLLALVPLGVALASPLLLPAQELAALGPRGAGITYHFAASWSWFDARVFGLMLLPRAWGGRPEYRGLMNYWEIQGYLGLLPTVLACAAPLKRSWLFLVAGVLGAWFSFGNNAWLDLHFLLWKYAPGMSGFRNPTRALLVTALCCAVVAAEGLARLRRAPRARFRVLAATGLLALGVGYVASHPTIYWPQAVRESSRVAAVLLVAGGVWAALARKHAAWAAAAIALFVCDLGYQTWDSPEIGPASAENHELEALDASVPRAPQPRRVGVLLDWGAANNATYARGLEGVTGYGPTPLWRVLALLDATRTGHVAERHPLDDDENFPRYRVDSPLAPLLAAPLLATSRDASVSPLARAGALRLYRTPALPRVYWTGSWEVADDAHVSAALRRAATGTSAVLAEPLATPSPPAPLAPVQASAVAVTTNSLRATLTAPADGLAVILDPYFPGWTATLDGKPARLLRANYAFQAVQVSAGTHELVLRYFPDRLLPGLLIAALAALALGFLLWKVRETAR